MEHVYNLFMETLYAKKDAYKVEETLIRSDASMPSPLPHHPPKKVRLEPSTEPFV